MRVVAIDDDEGTRQLLEIVCELEGWECVTGAGPEEVAPDVGDADVVLIDVHLRGRSGLDVVHDLRLAGVTTPIVMITGDVSDGVLTDALALGAFAVLHKPFEITTLIDAVASISHRRVASSPHV